jgi:DNA (cytosine-5)-methyltransferase 1
MSWDDVAPTLTTGCTDVTRGRFAHPEADRAITPREAALIQTFPSGYKFEGTMRAVATQIGNALPFTLLRALTPVFREALRSD